MCSTCTTPSAGRFSAPRLEETSLGFVVTGTLAAESAISITNNIRAGSYLYYKFGSVLTPSEKVRSSLYVLHNMFSVYIKFYTVIPTTTTTLLLLGGWTKIFDREALPRGTSRDML